MSSIFYTGQGVPPEMERQPGVNAALGGISTMAMEPGGGPPVNRRLSPAAMGLFGGGAFMGGGLGGTPMGPAFGGASAFPMFRQPFSPPQGPLGTAYGGAFGGTPPPGFNPFNITDFNMMARQQSTPQAYQGPILSPRLIHDRLSSHPMFQNPIFRGLLGPRPGGGPGGFTNYPMSAVPNWRDSPTHAAAPLYTGPPVTHDTEGPLPGSGFPEPPPLPQPPSGDLGDPIIP